MTAAVHLSKHHGLGNDFLIVLASRNPGIQPDPARARAWCDRHRGVGADGLIWLLPAERPQLDGRMVLHNSDGSEAEISGNGIRCLAHAIVRERGVASGDLVVGTAAGERRLTVTATGVEGTAWADAEMGPVGDGPAVPPSDRLAVPGAREVGSGEVGNPHLVVWVDGAWALDPAVVGPPIEALVPGGVNVHLIEPAPGSTGIRMRIWERGAGVTEACGSGATVAATWARRWGLVEGDVVEVEMPGGLATVRLEREGAVLGSPVTHVADVSIPGGRA